MIDLMVAHGGWIDAGSVGCLRNADLACPFSGAEDARRMLATIQ
jgi:hypothetical protein